jgi:hypothetical protein
MEGPAMNKKIWVGFIVVFIVWNILDYLVHGVLLRTAYTSPEMVQLLRVDMHDKMWIFYLVSLITSFFLTLIFSKWQTGKGLSEGIQFGVYVGLLCGTPMSYSSYAMYPIPYHLAMQWFIYGVLQFIILGIVLSLIFGKKPKTNAA